MPTRPYPSKSRPVFAPLELAPRLANELRSLTQDRPTPLAGRQFIIRDWERWGMEKRLAFLHALTEDWARDPAVAALTANILRNSGAIVRDYRAQWAAILAWVQDPANFYYVNEPGERIQSIQHSLTTGQGDCDDAAILTAGLGASVRLPFKFVISGVNGKGEKVRWIEGIGPVPPGVQWSHIYCAVGWPPFNPAAWEYAEPTLVVPLGWDVVSAPKDANGRTRLPEMEGRKPSKMLGEALGIAMPVEPDPEPPAASPIRGIWSGYLFTAPGGIRLTMPEGIRGRALAVLQPGGCVQIVNHDGSLQRRTVCPVGPLGDDTPVPTPAPVVKRPVRDFVAQIPLPQVAATLLAGVLSFVVTQGVIAPRLRRRR